MGFQVVSRLMEKPHNSAMAICKRGTGNRGIRESVKGGTGKLPVSQFSKYFYMKLRLTTYCFHLWASNDKSNKTDFTQNL